MKLNTSGHEIGGRGVATVVHEVEPSESAQAVQEFAHLIKQEARRRPVEDAGLRYEVHPCKRVRGYILRLPIIGWTLWYPTATAAVSFAAELAAIHRAECCVYDAGGSPNPCWELAEAGAN